MAKDFSEVGIDINMLKGSGNQRKGLCRRCSHLRQKNPRELCLSVNIAEGVWKCHNCDWSGTLEQGSNIMLPPPRIIKPFRKPIYRSSPIPPRVIDWFRKVRGISEDTLSAERIGWGKYYISDFEAEKDCVQFPYRRGTELINVKHIHFADGKKYPRQEKDAERIFYRLDHVDVNEVIVTEGEIDTLSCVEAGFDSTISVPDGAPQAGTKDYASKFTFCESAESILAPVKKIILAGDNDSAGVTLTDELARRFGVERCWSVEWPIGCKDANDVLVKHGKEKLRECIEAAKPWPVAGLAGFLDIERQIWDIFKNGLQRGASTGWRGVDKFYTVRPGEVTIVTGVPGHYKSTWLSSLFVNMAREHGWRFSLFSPEHPMDRMAITLLQQWTGKPFDE